MFTKFASIVAAVAAVFSTSSLHAKTIFYGPTPYLSAADSPFDLSGLGTTFWLEDFEDGMLNTPGVSHPDLEFQTGAVRGPGVATDSVDADDGVIDGLGQQGHSFVPFYEACFSRRCVRQAYFEFDASVLDRLPNFVGVVVTDSSLSVQENRFVGIGAFDTAGNVLDGTGFAGFGDNSAEGTTADDYFVGMYSAEGIAAFSVEETPGFYFEIDHLQYGFSVPEPSSVVLSLIAAAGYFARGMWPVFF